MNALELRQKTYTELTELLQQLLREKFNLRMQQGVSELSRPHLMKNVRRNVARVKTVMNEKRLVD